MSVFLKNTYYIHTINNYLCLYELYINVFKCVGTPQINNNYYLIKINYDNN